MQELWDYTITPNTIIAHFIHTLFFQKYVQMKKQAKDAQGMVSDLIANLRTKVKGQAKVQALKELQRLVATHSTVRKVVVDEGGVTQVSSLLGSFTSYVVGSEVIAILVNLQLSLELKVDLMQPAKVLKIVDILNDGSLETKVNCVKMIEMLIEGDDFREEIISSYSLLVALMRLVRDRRQPSGHLLALGLLKLTITHKQVQSLIVSIGAVTQLVELIHVLNPECVELALFVMDLLSSPVPEGRKELKDCPNAIPNVVKAMRISENCTKYALSILLSICKHYPEECPLIAMDDGLAMKLLLVIQSGSALKKRTKELLKLCTQNYLDTMFM